METKKLIYNNRKMNYTKHLESGSETWGKAIPISQESLWNVEISSPVVSEVKTEFIEDDIWNENMMSPEQLRSPEYINYHDNACDMFTEMKVEFSEDETFESGFSLKTEIFLKEEKIYKNIGNGQTQINNNTDDKFPSNEMVNDTDSTYKVNIKTEELEDRLITNKYSVKVKIKRLTDEQTLDDVKNTNVRYDVLVKPNKVQCKWCGRSFKNSFLLLRHNIEHLNLDINVTRRLKNKRTQHKKHKKLKSRRDKIPEQHESEGLYKCDVCDKQFKSHSFKLGHMQTVHSKRKYYCDICGKHFRCIQYINTHMQSIHLPEMRSNNLKCEYCDVVFKHKYNLHTHVKTVHNNVTFKCNKCDAMFKCKQYLISHNKRMHYDYGRMFPCSWCEREYRTPFHLHDHTKRIHIDMVKKLRAGIVVDKIKNKL